ncbi:MAG: outer membrane beta-barrel protein [Sediminibacterium sp.]|nr:outer membrane beta-barrel protein [Sediminibacterium sp.]
MLKKILTLSTCVLTLSSIKAQTDSTKKGSTTISGFADAYYRYNFSDAPGKTNNLTSFTNSQNSFELGMASIRVDHSVGKVSATADLGFGKRAQEFSYNDVGSLAIMKQLYLTYAASDKVKFTLGKWATHVGYELVDAPANRNYSMSYGFSYGPFFHTGLKADISLGGKSAFMIGVANPTDYTTTTSTIKHFLVQFSTGTKNDKLKTYVNFMTGGGTTQYNLVATAVLASKWSMAYDGSIQSTKAAGVTSSWKCHAVYLNFDPSSTVGITLRQDYFDDRKVNPISIDGKVFATTLSVNVKVEKLIIIPELRFDNANQSVFGKGDGSITKNTGSFILAAVYKF